MTGLQSTFDLLENAVSALASLIQFGLIVLQFEGTCLFVSVM